MISRWAEMDPRPQHAIDADRRLEVAGKLSWAIAQHGDWHPATWAALGRAFVYWHGFVRPKTPRFGDGGDNAALRHLSFEDREALNIRLRSAYTTAQLRELGQLGHYNRRERKFEANKKASRRALHSMITNADIES